MRRSILLPLVCAATLLLMSAAPPSARQLKLGCTRSEHSLCGWSVSWKNDVTTIERAADGLRIANTGDGVGFVERAVPLGGPADLRLVTLSALVKPSDVKAKGAGLTLAFLASDGSTLANHDMGYGDYGMAQGSGPYRKLEIVAAAPAEAVKAKAGLILYGPGDSTFRDVRLTVRGVGSRVSPFARGFVDEAARIMRDHALVRDKVDFTKLIRDGRRIAGSATRPEQAYPAIRYMIAELGDHHSFFFSREEIAHWKSGSSGGNDPVSMPSAREVDGFGYIRVPGFHSGASAAKAAFAQHLQDDIGNMAASGVKGWVVDLRDNDGGNMFPMLAGLAPLFDQPVLGYLVDAAGHRDAWGVGTAGPQPRDADYVPVTHPATLRSGMPIAVLFGRRTGSSGEIVILSFVRNSQTRSFGEPSWGLTTGNGIFPLSDGSELRLASTHMADRTGRTYDGPVAPDVVIKETGALNQDAALAAALEWLRSKATH